MTMATHVAGLTSTAETLRYRPALKLLLLVLLSLQAGLCWTARGRSLRGQVDLRAFYATGALVRDGHLDRIYDDQAEEEVQHVSFHEKAQTLHFLYPVFAAPLCALIAWVPYKTAFALVLMVDLLCLYLCATLLAREHQEWGCRPPLLCAMALVFLPAAIALMQGQISFLLLLIFTAAYVLERRDSPWFAGLCLALGLVKFQIVLPVAVLYACWRKWKLVGGFAAGAAALLTVSLCLSGVAGLHAYANRLHGVGAATLLHAHGAHLRYGMEVANEPNLHGLATMIAGDGHTGALCTLMLSLPVLLWSVFRGRQTIATALPAALLLSYHMQPYDLVLLLLPLVLLVQPLLHTRSASIKDRKRVDRGLLFASMLLMTAPVAYYLQLREDTVWFTLASLFVLLASSRRQGEEARAVVPGWRDALQPA